MKNLIFFASSYKVGLTGQLTEQACTLVHRFRDKILVISGENEQFPGLFNRLDECGVNYARIMGLDEHRNFGRLVKEFKACVEKVQANVVHVRTNWQLAIAVAVKYFYKKNYLVIYTIHGYRHNYKYRSAIARYMIGFGLYIFADVVITPSSFLKRKFSFLRRKNELLFIGVDNSFFIEYQPPSFTGIKRLIFAGDFREGKNQDLLIRVIRKYIDRTGDRSVELYLPGKGKKLDACKALCNQLELENNVFFPGFLNRSEILRYYLMCQFAIVPSNVETFGHCITEPFVLGRVVISRRVGVADDIIIPGKTGYFFNTEEELLEVLLKLLPDEDKCRLMSENAYSRRDVFRWDVICEKYFEILEGLNPP